MAGARAVVWLLAAGLMAAAAAAKAAPEIADVQGLIAVAGSQVTRHDRAAGDPYLDVVTGGLAWRLYFVDCGTRRPFACQAMSLRIGFAHAGLRTLDSVNRWNLTHLFCRAYLDAAGTPSLAQDVTLAGTDGSTIAAYLKRWQSDIERFHDFVEQGPAP